MSNVPPNDVEAERVVLSAAITDREACDIVMETLTPEAYYETSHGVLHQACSSLAESGSAVDALTVMSWVRDRDLVGRVGGARYLGEMLDATPAVANVAKHCEIVKRKWTMRRAIRICQHYAANGYTTTADPVEFLDALEQAIFDLSIVRKGTEPSSMRDVLTDTFQRLRDAESHGRGVTGLSTGLTAFDEQTSGLHPGELIIVAARPGMGKTAMVLDMVLSAAKQQGTRPLTGSAFFSLEMPKHQLGLRAACSAAGVDLGDTRRLNITNEQMHALVGACGPLAELPVQVDDTPGLTLSELRAKTRRVTAKLRSEHNVPLGLIAVDYLQLMTGSGQNRENEISAISRGLKQIAKEFSVPVVALAQLNRKVEERKDKRPMLSDIRESGSIEQDADAVVFIYRDEYYNADTKDPGVAEIIVAKQRNGPPGVVRVAFEAKTASFRDLVNDAWQPEQWA